MDKVARWLRRLSGNPWVFDSGLALVAAGMSAALFVIDNGPVGVGWPRGTLTLAYALVLLHTLPLAARRRSPLLVCRR